MIPQKPTPDTDLGAKLDEDLKKAEEQQKEIKSKKPKLAQAMASKWTKYIVIGATAVGIAYKMFFAPTAEPVKKKKTNKVAKSSSANKEKEQKKMAEEKVNRSKSGEVAQKTDEKSIISLGEQSLSNSEQLSKISVPKLQLPETPPVPQINAIDIIADEKKKDNKIEEPKETTTNQQTGTPNDYVEVEEEVIENGKKVKKLTKKQKTPDANNKNKDDNTEKDTALPEGGKKKRKIKQKMRDKSGKIKTITTEVEMTDEEYANFKANAKNNTDKQNKKSKKNKNTPLDSPLSKATESTEAEESDEEKEENLPSKKDKKGSGKKSKNSKNKTKDGSGSVKQLGETALEEMFILAGNGPKEKSSKNSSSSSSKKDFILFDGASLAEKAITTTEASSSISRLNNLENTIASGKIMEAVLETAINSEATGTIRAVMSKDVYGEAGNKILIPRGSRLYGSYTTTTSTVQTRLLLTWNKVIRPDGVVITMNADTYDQSGKKGIEGDIDTRYGELFKNSLLYSFVTLGTAIAVEKIAGIKNATSVNTATGTTVTNTSPANAAAQSVIDTAQDIAEKMTDGLTDDLNPVISIPQGTLLKIMSSTDIVINSAYKRRTQDVKID